MTARRWGSRLNLRCPSSPHPPLLRPILQSPLQPLQDNLESQTYETFERDGTKYSTYEEAVYRCLLDRVPQVHGGGLQGAAEAGQDGAGRGGAGGAGVWQRRRRCKPHVIRCRETVLAPHVPRRRRRRAA